jgi:4-amino-4-deoxy-L-arabinose transferase-like glycosyltransferase
MLSKLKESHYLWLVCAVCVVVYLFDLGSPDIWDIDEGMHAAMAQNMILNGDWVTPVFNSEAFLDKPPLINWLTAVSFLLLGFTEFAARLPNALAGFGTVLLTFFFARRIYGPRTALYAGLMLATAFEFILVSRLVQYDIPFVFCTTLAIFCYGYWVLDEDRSSRYLIGMYAAIGLGVLTKGMIGILLPGIAVVGHIVLTQDWKRLWTTISFVGIGVFLVIVVPWYALMERANPGYLEYFIITQHFGNFIGGEGALKPRHPQPIIYFIPVLLAGLLPWSLMLPQTLTRTIRRELRENHGMGALLVSCVVGIFLFHSVATSKLATYILPVWPAACILIARYWHQRVDAEGFPARRGLLWGIGIWVAIMIALTVYVFTKNPWTFWEYEIGFSWLSFKVFLLIVTGLYVAAFFTTFLRQRLATLTLFCIVSPITYFYILEVMSPPVDANRGGREIGYAIDEILPEGEIIVFYGQLLDSSMFYTRRDGLKLRNEDELNAYLDSPERRYVVVRERVRTAAEAFQGDYHVLQTIGNKAIVSNQPDPPAAGNAP